MDTRDLDTKLDRIAEDITEIKVTSAKQEENLKAHMRRTELAEEAIKLAREAAELRAQTLEAELRPVKEHVAFVNSIFKFIGAVSVLLGIALAIKQLVS